MSSTEEQGILEKIELGKLPHRPATTEERYNMTGSLAGQYEMKVPLLHIDGSKKFWVLWETHTDDCPFTKNPTQTCTCGGTRRYRLNPMSGRPHIVEGDKLVVLRTEETLLSLYYKPPKKKKRNS